MSIEQAQSLQVLGVCKTSRLGWHCEACGEEHEYDNSCRNRNCPHCLDYLQDEWASRRCEEVLPVRYYHVVFTFPHEINVLLE